MNAALNLRVSLVMELDLVSASVTLARCLKLLLVNFVFYFVNEKGLVLVVYLLSMAEV